MKAIIIQDHDARALLDQLKLETMDAKSTDYAHIEIGVRKILATHPAFKSERDVPIELSGAIASMLCSPAGEIVQRIHRRFHYVVCCWLQEQGASVVR
jgi:hypothetical protein